MLKNTSLFSSQRPDGTHTHIWTPNEKAPLWERRTWANAVVCVRRCLSAQSQCPMVISEKFMVRIN